MDNSPQPNPAIEARILVRIVEDQAEGSVLSVEEYAALFPGQERVVQHLLNNLTVVTEHSDKTGFLSTATALDTLGPFKLVRELGRGGQGVVYLAEDSRLENRQVALKVLAARLEGSDALKERFAREARLTARLNHPGIAPIHEVGEDEGVHYIAMGYVKGDPLSKRIHETRTSHAFPESEFISFDGDEGPGVEARQASDTRPVSGERITEMTRIILGVAEILEVAHSAGLVHRDIKPGNIMVTPTGQPVLLDFGLARDDESDEGLTISGAAMGTPAYMSPEQIAGHRDQIDQRTDIYSLGITTFEALSLSRPFRSATRQGLYRAILEGTGPDIRELNPTIRRDLAVVIETMMHSEQNRRYQSASLLVQDLRAVLEGRSINAQPDRWGTKVVRWARRNPVVAISTSAAAFILMVSLFVINNTLNSYKELADLQLVSQLEEEALSSLPATLATSGKIEGWLTRSRRLTESLPRHESELNRLREDALPYTDEDRSEDRESHPQLPTLRNLRRRIARLDEQVELIDDDPTQELAEIDEMRILRAQESMETEIKAIESQLEVRRIFVFDDHEMQWQHDALSELTHGLQRLKSETIPFMEKQLQMARDGHRRSIAEAQELWQVARASIANRELCPLYDGLKIQPQEGLVPLARNEKTGLWSFRHLPTQGTSSKDTAVAATTFVLIPGGTFRMGAIPAPTPGPNIDTAAGIDEAPITSIALSPFFISSVEITQSRWQEVMNSNPSYYPAGSLRGRVVTWENPVENITHAEAAEYCRRLGLQLPTEAQWEYVARAGTDTVWPTGNDKNSLRGSINIADQAARAGGATWPEIDEWPEFMDGHAIHAPAGSFRPNAFGIFDMQGNVWEWCRDGYTPYNNTPEPEDGLRLRARSTSFVMRGGSFRNSVGRTRCAHRGSIGSSIRNGNIGFRAIRKLQK